MVFPTAAAKQELIGARADPALIREERRPVLTIARPRSKGCRSLSGCQTLDAAVAGCSATSCSACRQEANA